MTNPEDVTFSKVDPKTGTVVEFKGPNGAKVAYDAPHADMDVTAGHDKPHVGWQSAGKEVPEELIEVILLMMAHNIRIALTLREMINVKFKYV